MSATPFASVRKKLELNDMMMTSATTAAAALIYGERTIPPPTLFSASRVAEAGRWSVGGGPVPASTDSGRIDVLPGRFRDFVDDRAAAHDQRSVGDGRDLLGVVRDDDRRHAGRCPRPDVVVDAQAGAGVDAAG